MLGKRPLPMIGKLSELLVSGSYAAALFYIIRSPRNSLGMNFKMHSPKGLKSCDLGGVGLGIVVALDYKSGEEKILPKHAVCTSNLNRSVPIPVHSKKTQDGFQRVVNEIDHVGSISEEYYTYVTCHVPNKTFNKVYYDGGESGIGILRHGYHITNKNNVLRRTTPPNFVEADEPSSPATSDFLSSCHLCRKKLHGKDIYMYRGEKGFCSPECRSRQIMMEERKEQCRSEASRSLELSRSHHTQQGITFSTGILAL